MHIDCFLNICLTSFGKFFHTYFDLSITQRHSICESDSKIRNLIIFLPGNTNKLIANVVMFNFKKNLIISKNKKVCYKNRNLFACVVFITVWYFRAYTYTDLLVSNTRVFTYIQSGQQKPDTPDFVII